MSLPDAIPSNNEDPYSPPEHEGHQGVDTSRDRTGGASRGCALGGCALPIGIFIVLIALKGEGIMIIFTICIIIGVIGAPIGLMLGAIFGIRRKPAKDSERDPTSS